MVQRDDDPTRPGEGGASRWVPPTAGVDPSPSPAGESGRGAAPAPADPRRADGTAGAISGAPAVPKAGNARTGPLPLHPMSIADILDGTFKIFRANAGSILLIVAVLSVPVQILASFASRETFQVGLLDVINDPTLAQSQDAALVNPGQFLSTVLGVLVTPFIAGAVARVVAASYLGRQLKAGPALRGALGRFWALLGSFILIHILEVAGALLCILPAFLVMAMFVLTAPAIAIEELGPIQGMRRSWHLVKPRLWPVLGIALLAGLLASVVGLLFSGIPSFIGLFFGGTLAWVLVGVASALASLVAEPIVTIAATLLYLDARIRHEAFDLQVMAADLNQ